MTETTVQKVDRLKELDEQGEFPARWDPQEGDSIEGVVRRYTDVELEKSGLTRLCVVEKEDGEVETIFLSATVLKSEFKKQRPMIGERIFVRYLGTPKGKSYKKYVLRVQDREESADPNWDDFGEAYEYDRSASQPAQPRQQQQGRPAPPPPVNMASTNVADPHDPFKDEMEGNAYAQQTMRR
jgi:hypothetical protein